MEKSLAWEAVRSPLTIIEKLKGEGFTVAGIDQDKRTQDYKTHTPPEKIVVLVGNEVRELSSSLRDYCDVLLEIPMRGKKESLCGCVFWCRSFSDLR